MLRRFRDSDLEPFLADRADPNVGRYQDWGTTRAPTQNGF